MGFQISMLTPNIVSQLQIEFLYHIYEAHPDFIQWIITEMNNVVQDRFLLGIILGMAAAASWLLVQSKVINDKAAHFSVF